MALTGPYMGPSHLPAIAIKVRSFFLVQKYHSSRVLTLVYQPIALGTVAVLAYNEAKINTRRRNLFGYILFFISSLSVLVVIQFVFVIPVFHKKIIYSLRYFSILFLWTILIKVISSSPGSTINNLTLFLSCTNQNKAC